MGWRRILLPWQRREVSEALAQDLLQKALVIGIRCSAHYPRVLETLRAVLSPGFGLVEHFREWGPLVSGHLDRPAILITQLGSEPIWLKACRDEEMNFPEYFAGEVVRAGMAVSLCKQASELVPERSLRATLKELVSDLEQDMKRISEIQVHVEDSRASGVTFRSFLACPLRVADHVDH